MGPESLRSDTPATTAAGHIFVVPGGWSVTVGDRITTVTAPEGDSRVAFVDMKATDAATAVEGAWAIYGRVETHSVMEVEPLADHDGWKEIHRFKYRVPPSERRFILAEAARVGDAWLVTLVDMSNNVAEKRLAQLLLLLDGRQPKGYEPESFAGRAANRLDSTRVAELTGFVDRARTKLGVPGVALGIVEDGKVAFLGGFGVRELGKQAKVDADTRFMIASNTKALTTLMLAKLVEQKKLTWTSRASSLLPAFKLGDAETTSKVQVEHLVCACTGLARQDFESLFEFGNVTPKQSMERLATMQPTSGFGELYQYSNGLAAAAGFVGGHVAFPQLELGEAYDQAMQSEVFVPLGMHGTTLDHRRAQRGNWARPHWPDVDGTMSAAVHAVNASAVPTRPSGGAWSTARDMLAYVQMELAEGLLPDGKRYIGRDELLARRAPQIATGKHGTYGMGLEVETKYDVMVVHHGGAMVGYYSDMLWLPGHGVGAVILTNGAPGWTIHEAFERKLLEVLFDGRPHADAEVAAVTTSYYAGLAAARHVLDVPADPEVAAQLASSYNNAALGDVRVRRVDDKVVLDFGEWETEVASRKNADGTTSIVGISPGIDWVDFLVGEAVGKRTLTALDYQHEYVFVEGGPQ